MPISDAPEQAWVDTDQIQEDDKKPIKPMIDLSQIIKSNLAEKIGKQYSQIVNERIKEHQSAVPVELKSMSKKEKKEMKD